MARAALTQRVEILESTVRDLPARLTALESEIKEFRIDVRDEFAAVRAEMQGEFSAVRGEMRATTDQSLAETKHLRRKRLTIIGTMVLAR